MAASLSQQDRLRARQKPLLRLIPLTKAARRSIWHPDNESIMYKAANGTVFLELGGRPSCKGDSRTIATIGGPYSDVRLECDLAESGFPYVQCEIVAVSPRAVLLVDRSPNYSTKVSEVYRSKIKDKVFHFASSRVLVGTGVNTAFEAGTFRGTPLPFQIEWLFDTFSSGDQDKNSVLRRCQLKMRIAESIGLDVQLDPTIPTTFATGLPSAPFYHSDTSPYCHTTTGQPIRHFMHGRPSRGYFSLVHKTIDVDSGQFMAVKVLQYKRGSGLSSQSWARDIWHEIDILEKVRHIRIIEYFGSHVWVATRAEIFTNLMHGTLKDLVDNNVDRDVFQHDLRDQMLEALSFLASKGIVHRDIKPSNVLYECHADGSYNFRLCDFGLAVYANDPAVPRGTQTYAAPETRWTEDGGLTCKADVWSLFVTMLWTLNAASFRTRCERQLIKGRDSVYLFVADMKYVPGGFFESLRGMAALDVQSRSTAQQVLDGLRQPVEYVSSDYCEVIW